MIRDPSNLAPYFGDPATEGFKGFFGEQIWGHRLERQPQSALLLEFLGMAEGMLRENQLFVATEPGADASYAARKASYLRALVFCNPRLQAIADKHRGADARAWDEWLADMRERSDGFDYTYLRRRIESLAELTSRISLVRGIIMDGSSSRKWTHQLLYPVGPDALFIPLSAAVGGRDRVLFTRTGELAYLMVSRAKLSLTSELATHVRELLDGDGPKNRLLRGLIPASGQDFVNRGGGTYLPYRSHPAFDRLAEDLLAILRLRLPGHDALEHIRVLLPFHLYLYATQTAYAWTVGEQLHPMVFEILAPSMDVVRRASIESRETAEAAAVAAVRSLVEPAADAFLAEHSGATGEELADFLTTTFHLRPQDRSALPIESVEEVRRAVRDMAESGVKDGVVEAMMGLGASAELITSEKTRKHRYAPSDRLLKALVLATVVSPKEELAPVLRRWFDRYRIAIGTEEAPAVCASLYDEGDFDRNHERLVRRLAGMGLARRMSDDCTYVINPYVDPCA